MPDAEIIEHYFPDVSRDLCDVLAMVVGGQCMVVGNHQKKFAFVL